MFLAHVLMRGGGDLPMPVWFFAWAAGIVLVISFFGLAAGWRRPRFEDDSWRPSRSRLLAASAGPLSKRLAKAVGLALLLLVIYAGVAGTSAAERNFSVTFVFVTVWIGLPLVSAIAGNFFPAFEPWSVLGRAAGRVYTTAAKQPPPRVPYPARLGRWPAALALLAFAWFELIYGSDLSRQQLDPRAVATMAIAYSLYTLLMMAVFGTRAWLRNGELFSAYGAMFASLSRLELRSGRVGVRRWLSGTTKWPVVPGSLALVVAAIAATTFDGAQNASFGDLRQSLTDGLADLGLAAPWPAWIADTGLLMATFGAIFALYLVGIVGMSRVPLAPTARVLRDRFAHTLIPIALAYIVAHYFTYFSERMQAQFTYLISDPLGTGADLLGLSGAVPDADLFSTSFVWYVQLFALLAGHVTGLMLAHDRALTVWRGDLRLAARSQYWMLFVMLGLTSLGLFLLSATNA